MQERMRRNDEIARENSKYEFPMKIIETAYRKSHKYQQEKLNKILTRSNNQTRFQDKRLVYKHRYSRYINKSQNVMIGEIYDKLGENAENQKRVSKFYSKQEINKRIDAKDEKLKEKQKKTLNVFKSSKNILCRKSQRIKNKASKFRKAKLKLVEKLGFKSLK